MIFTTTELYRGIPTNDVYIVGTDEKLNELELVKYIAEITGESISQVAKDYKDSFNHWKFNINEPFSKM
jgi:hypothetical protein